MKFLNSCQTINKQALNLTQLCQEFISNPAQFLRDKLTNAEIKIFNTHIWFQNAFGPRTTQSQIRMANIAGTSTKTIGRSAKKFRELGLITTKQRFNKTLIYEVNPVVFQPQIRRKIMGLLTALQFMSLSYVLSANQYNNSNSSQSEYVRIEKESNINLNNYIINCVSNTVNRYTTKKIVHEAPPTVGIQNSFYTKRVRRGIVMRQFNRVINGDVPVADIVRNLKLPFTLSKWAQMKLSAFPDSAIIHMQSKVSAGILKMHNPFAVLFKLCIDWCNQYQISPDFVWYDLCKKKYNIPDDAPMILDLQEKRDKNTSDNAYYVERKKTFSKEKKLNSHNQNTSSSHMNQGSHGFKKSQDFISENEKKIESVRNDWSSKSCEELSRIIENEKSPFMRDFLIKIIASNTNFFTDNGFKTI